MNVRSVTRVLLTLAVMASANRGGAAVPNEVKLTCSSNRIGIVSVRLHSPDATSPSAEIGYYKIEATRFDSDGVFLDKTDYPLEYHPSGFFARVSSNDGPVSYYPEATLELELPAITPAGLWEKFPSQCFVKVPYAGFKIYLGLKSSQLVKNSRPMITPYVTNPEVTTEIIPGWGAPTLKRVLNGHECPDLDLWKDAENMKCVVQ